MVKLARSAFLYPSVWVSRFSRKHQNALFKPKLLINWIISTSWLKQFLIKTNSGCWNLKIRHSDVSVKKCKYLSKKYLSRLKFCHLHMGQSLRKVNMNTYKLELGASTVMLPKQNFWDKILYTYPSFWLNLLGQHFLYPSLCLQIQPYFSICKINCRYEELYKNKDWLKFYKKLFLMLSEI